MGRGRGRVVVAGCVAGAIALAVAGCGSQEHPNEGRPQPPTRVSVTLTTRAITMQPPRIAFGPEPSQQIPQNQHAGQPQVHSKAPLDVVFVAANMTTSDSKLELRGPTDATSGPLVANGNGSFQASLPTGSYAVRAAGIPGSKPVKFTVGPYRSSSQNNVLLP
jgi:hypothetical protein